MIEIWGYLSCLDNLDFKLDYRIVSGYGGVVGTELLPRIPKNPDAIYKTIIFNLSDIRP